MIINNTYFFGEIYIPHAKPSVTDDVTAIQADILTFINEYEKECLIKCLGYQLYKEFAAQLDSEQPNGLKTGSDEKWDRLLNGFEYTNPSGELTYWKGIRSKNDISTDVYNQSFLAFYVYYKYEKSVNESRVGVGNVQEQAKNAEVMSKRPKVVNAWRKFFNWVQGGAYFPSIIVKSYGFGVDWLGEHEELTLYKFIRDMNELNGDDYYEGFNPKTWRNINQALF